MIRIYIVDDEKKSIDNLEYLLNQDINEDIIIKSSNDPLDAIEQIRKFEPDLLFLDVQMPHLDGFGIIKALGKIDFEVIFITAYEQYAIDAIRNSALDYLLKPIDGDDLMSAFNRFKIKREKKDKINEESISALASNGKIAIQQLEGIHFIEINKILRLESDGNYTKIFSDDGSFKLVRRR